MGKQADAIGNALSAQVAKATKTLILEIDANLRAAPSAGGTPVDTGHARSNWIPSIGAPATDVVTSEDAGPHDAGVAAVLAFKLGQGALYESNNAPYITALDLGHSHQAPAGFVESAVDRASATVQQRYDSLQIDVTTQGAGTFADAAGGAAAANLGAAYSPFGGDG